MSRAKKIVAGGGIVLFVALVGVVAACVFLRIREVRHIEAYIEMMTEFEPVWREFAFRRLSSGDSARELVRRHEPTRIEAFGRYAIYRFYNGGRGSLPMSGLNVIARDGRLLSAYAGSCTWEFTFFETEDPELEREYEAYWTEKRKKWARRDLNNYATKLVGFYGKNERWPTNVQEFSGFIDSDLTSTNSSSIRLEVEEDGTMVIGSFRFPEVKRQVLVPKRSEGLRVTP